jgi:hypothetical protein
MLTSLLALIMPSAPAQPTVESLVKNRAVVKKRFPLTQPITYRGSPTAPDTPTASLLRLFEFFVVEWTTQIRNELEYFNRQHTWAVADIPDPADPDPVRYAILAVLTKLMCTAFNGRIEMGLPRDTPAIIMDWDELAARPKVLEHPPSWALAVGRVRKEGEFRVPKG